MHMTSSTAVALVGRVGDVNGGGAQLRKRPIRRAGRVGGGGGGGGETATARGLKSEKVGGHHIHRHHLAPTAAQHRTTTTAAAAAIAWQRQRRWRDASSSSGRSATCRAGIGGFGGFGGDKKFEDSDDEYDVIDVSNSNSNSNSNSSNSSNNSNTSSTPPSDSETFNIELRSRGTDTNLPKLAAPGLLTGGAVQVERSAQLTHSSKAPGFSVKAPGFQPSNLSSDGETSFKPLLSSATCTGTRRAAQQTRRPSGALRWGAAG
jgi:hypothetical protein